MSIVKLNNDARLVVIVAELGGRTSFLALEDAVEIAQVVETATETDFRNAARRVNEHSGGIAQAHVDDVVGEVASGVQLEEPAEGAGAHAGDVGQRGQSHLVHIVFADVVFHFQYATAVVLDSYFGVAAGGKGARAVATRKLIENGEELLHGIEPVLDGAERIEHAIDLHDGRQRETKPFARLVHHLSHADERIAPEEVVLVHVEIELDGDFADILVAAFVLLPDMLKVGTGDEHQVVVANHLARIAHNAAHATGMLNKVEFIDLVVVDGIGELFFVPVGYVENVFSHERGDLVYYVSIVGHGSWVRVMSSEFYRYD